MLQHIGIICRDFMLSICRNAIDCPKSQLICCTLLHCVSVYVPADHLSSLLSHVISPNACTQGEETAVVKFFPANLSTRKLRSLRREGEALAGLVLYADYGTLVS